MLLVVGSEVLTEGSCTFQSRRYYIGYFLYLHDAGIIPNPAYQFATGYATPRARQIEKSTTLEHKPRSEASAEAPLYWVRRPRAPGVRLEAVYVVHWCPCRGYAKLQLASFGEAF